MSVSESRARFWKDQGRKCSGKGPRKERVRFLTRSVFAFGMCSLSDWVDMQEGNKCSQISRGQRRTRGR